MNAQCKNIVDAISLTINNLLAEMTPQERVDFWESLQAGYCKHCGGEWPVGGCQCENDE